MNKILVANGLLLISLMGFLQWYERFIDSSFFYPWSGIGLLFLFASFITPLFFLINNKLQSKARRAEFLAFLIFNPLLFSFMTYCSQSLNNDFNWGQIAGPQIITLRKDDQPSPGLFTYCAILGLALEQTIELALKHKS